MTKINCTFFTNSLPQKNENNNNKRKHLEFFLCLSIIQIYSHQKLSFELITIYIFQPVTVFYHRPSRPSKSATRRKFVSRNKLLKKNSCIKMLDQSQNAQKQSLADVLQNNYSEKFRKFYSKTPVLEPHFNKVAGLQVWSFIKKRLQHRCFPVKFATFLRTPFLKEHLYWLLLNACEFNNAIITKSTFVDTILL